MAHNSRALPAPGRPLLAYRGVLAPHAAWRAAIVPQPAAQDDARLADPSARARRVGSPSVSC